MKAFDVYIYIYIYKHFTLDPPTLHTLFESSQINVPPRKHPDTPHPYPLPARAHAHVATLVNIHAS